MSMVQLHPIPGSLGCVDLESLSGEARNISVLLTSAVQELKAEDVFLGALICAADDLAELLSWKLELLGTSCARSGVGRRRNECG